MCVQRNLFSSSTHCCTLPCCAVQLCTPEYAQTNGEVFVYVCVSTSLCESCYVLHGGVFIFLLTPWNTWCFLPFNCFDVQGLPTRLCFLCRASCLRSAFTLIIAASPVYVLLESFHLSSVNRGLKSLAVFVTLNGDCLICVCKYEMLYLLCWSAAKKKNAFTQSNAFEDLPWVLLCSWFVLRLNKHYTIWNEWTSASLVNVMDYEKKLMNEWTEWGELLFLHVCVLVEQKIVCAFSKLP